MEVINGVPQLRMWLLTSPFDTRLVLCVSIALVALAALAFCLERASGQCGVVMGLVLSVRPEIPFLFY